MSTNKKAVRTHSAPNWPPSSVLNPGPNHKWSREVVFDFHEVVVKWVEQFTTFLNLTYGYNMKPGQRFYNMQFDPSTPITPEQFDDAFVTFARLSVGGYGDLKAHEGIKETMEAIVAAGIKIQIWTWTPGAAEIKADGAGAYNTGIAQRVTRELIRKLDLPIDVERDVRFMKPDRKKWEMAEEHIPLIVEDNPETAVAVGLGIAHAAILVPEPYNEGLVAPNVLRLSDRNDLAPCVINFFQKLDDAKVLL
jgi:hypothetical protein